MQRTVARWLIDHAPDATLAVVSPNFPVRTRCTCNQCRNFEAAAGRNFPSEFLALLDVLGK